jgi:hypothetical protein
VSCSCSRSIVETAVPSRTPLMWCSQAFSLPGGKLTHGLALSHLGITLRVKDLGIVPNTC